MSLMPMKIRCLGSDDEVDGPDEPDGTVFCNKCGTTFLPMKTKIIDGKKRFFVSEHYRTPSKSPKKKVGRRRISPRS